MKKLLLAGLILLSPSAHCFTLPSKAEAQFVCGPTVCSKELYCGHHWLPAGSQHCAYPRIATFCQTRMCTGGSWYMAWTWSW